MSFFHKDSNALLNTARAFIKLKQNNFYGSFLHSFSILLSNYNAVIAGGAIRDFIFDKSINDIDVFYVGECPEVIPITPVPEVPYGDTTECTLTHEGIFGSYKVQFIRINNDEHISYIVEQFPCSISKCFALTGTLYLETSFLESAFNAKVYWDEFVDVSYQDKIITKYPELLHKIYSTAAIASALGVCTKKVTNKYLILNSPIKAFRELVV